MRVHVAVRAASARERVLSAAGRKRDGAARAARVSRVRLAPLEARGGSARRRRPRLLGAEVGVRLRELLAERGRLGRVGGRRALGRGRALRVELRALLQLVDERREPRERGPQLEQRVRLGLDPPREQGGARVRVAGSFFARARAPAERRRPSPRRLQRRT